MTVDYMATADMARFFMGMVKEAIEEKKITFEDEEIEVRQLRQLYLMG